jgi:ABC-type multidrug transport system ATPase subunit
LRASELTLFAVFRTNPAPICVLDEVDAPLDDHNVKRFCDLLDEMTHSTDTRFVIITHNPITMARMNRLFGVTMAERGVSQLVSVDLEASVRFREASQAASSSEWMSLNDVRFTCQKRTFAAAQTDVCQGPLTSDLRLDAPQQSSLR